MFYRGERKERRGNYLLAFAIAFFRAASRAPHAVARIDVQRYAIQREVAARITVRQVANQEFIHQL